MIFSTVTLGGFHVVIVPGFVISSFTYLVSVRAQKILMSIFIAITIACFGASIVLGRQFGLVDHPDARKQHRGAVPLTGGMAIFASLLTGLWLLPIAPYSTEMMIIAGAVFALALVDDRLHVAAHWRLALYYLSGVALATYGGVIILDVGNLLAMGDIPLLLLAVPLTALSVAGLSNAYNMIDGIDGLAAGTVALPLLVLFVLGQLQGNEAAGFLLLILIPLSIFLVFNLGPNRPWLPKIFLGDAGSITLGFLVTASLVYFSQQQYAGDSKPLILPVTALWLVTVPLMDMLATMLRRALAGDKLMEADRRHLHHTLMDRGLSSRQTLAVLLVWAALCAGIGLVLENIPEYLSLLAYFLLFLAHCRFVVTTGRRAQKPATRPGI